MLNINSIYEKYLEKMSLHDKNYELSVRFIRNQLNELQYKYKNTNDDTELYYEISQFYPLGNTKKTIEIYDKRNVSLKMLKDDIINHQNIQYQWLLVSAFEDFEKYLKEIYAYIIFIQNKPKNIDYLDFINIFEKIYYLLLENLEKKNASSILSEIRRILPNYKKIEINNESNLNLKFFLLLIQNFRNIIVHNNGKTNNKDGLFEKIISNIGLSGKSKEKCAKIFQTYFPDNSDKIILLEIPVLEIGDSLKAETTVLLNLFTILLNSAYNIAIEVKNIFGA